MSLSRHSPFAGIPREICEQEREIEAMFRELVCEAEEQGDYTRHQKVSVLVLVVVLGFMSVVAFAALWLKAAGDCGLYQAPCG